MARTTPYRLVPCCRLARLLWGALLVPSLALAAEHEFAEFTIGVSADAGPLSESPDYQITVDTEELRLTRLSAGYQGSLSNSFVADLDKDGSFEVVVTYSYEDGHATGVHVYSWKDYLLQPLKLSEMNDAQSSGYRGNDQYAVVNGELVRIFQLYEQGENDWQPTAEQRRLRYSFAESRWLGE